MPEEIKLTGEDQVKLEGLSGDIDFLDQELAKAERAGLDISKLKEDFVKVKGLREGLLREYT